MSSNDTEEIMKPPPTNAWNLYLGRDSCRDIEADLNDHCYTVAATVAATDTKCQAQAKALAQYFPKYLNGAYPQE